MIGGPDQVSAEWVAQWEAVKKNAPLIADQLDEALGELRVMRDEERRRRQGVRGAFALFLGCAVGVVVLGLMAGWPV